MTQFESGSLVAYYPLLEDRITDVGLVTFAAGDKFGVLWAKDGHHRVHDLRAWRLVVRVLKGRELR